MMDEDARVESIEKIDASGDPVVQENSDETYSVKDNLEKDIESGKQLHTDQPLNEQLNIDDFDSNIPQPYVGMKFDTYENAFFFYNAYAKHKGFGIRKHSTRKSRRTGEVSGRNYVCNKQGQKKACPNTRFSRKDTRVGCSANMWISKNQESGNWSVTIFEDVHNHPLSTPTSSSRHRSHQKFHLSKQVKDLTIFLHNEARLPPSKIARVINAQSGRTDETITSQQCQEHLRLHRKRSIEKEYISIVQYFQDRRATDSQFYFAFQLDEKKTLRSVFWADWRSIASYLEFSDMLVFDVIHQTNRFSMPFAPFTGVNHHRQSTLFGCALLADETEDTFVWLFGQWLKCMCGKTPISIITDQDPAICEAVKIIFSDTLHRYCSWHVDKHLDEHLQLLQDPNSSFKHDYNAWFKCNTIEDSETHWMHLKEKYELENNTWMMKMYHLREHWVPVYWRNTFTAGMQSSQRSESMNSFFDGYVDAMTPLSELVMKYEQAISSRRMAEKDEDFLTLNSRPRCETELDMELQAANSYTKTMFQIFRVEFVASASYLKEKVRKEGSKTIFLVGKKLQPKSSWRTVIYDTSNGVELNCSCAKFEIEGMLCRHVLSIMRFKMIHSIPNQYVLRRWTMDARYTGPSSSNIAGHKDSMVTPIMMFYIRAKTNKLLDKVSCSIEEYNEYDKWLDTKLQDESEENKIEDMVVESSTDLPPADNMDML